MNAVTEPRSTLTDQQVEHLLEFPEVVEAIEAYTAIKARYRGLLARRVRESEELPDVSDISADLDRELDAQQAVIRRLIDQHLTQSWMLNS